jgi:thiol-disulfide isomerase/thioredoxin
MAPRSAALPRVFEGATLLFVPINRLVSILTTLVVLSTIFAVSASAAEPAAFRSASSQFVFLRPVDPAPKTVVQAIDGTPVDLGQFRGRVVLLNFWATWCLPCAYEIPSLDRLAAAADPHRLAIVAVAIDQDGAAAVAPFLRAHGLTHLSIGLDPGQHLGSLTTDQVSGGALPLWGLPMTYLIDKRGGVVGYITGAVEWDSPKAHAFLDYFINEN